MIRKHKKYSRPRKLYDSVRIKEENKLVDRYALKNKREIWKVESQVKYLRDRAKKLITAHHTEQNKYFTKLQALGLQVSSIADVLALTKEDLFKRRLTTILVSKKLAHTTQMARQMVTHKRVFVGDGIVSAPSYLVPVKEESSLRVKPGREPAAKEETPEAVVA